MRVFPRVLKQALYHLWLRPSRPNLATELASAGYSFVVIESNEGRSEKIEKLGYLHMEGDATIEILLCHARIERVSTKSGSDPE